MFVNNAQHCKGTSQARTGLKIVALCLQDCIFYRGYFCAPYEGASDCSTIEETVFDPRRIEEPRRSNDD